MSLIDVQLRDWSLDDLENLVRYGNNPKIAKNLTNAFPRPYTEEAGKRFIEKACSDNPRRIFAVSVDYEAVGAIGIHPQEDIFCKNAELGYWLAEPFWGKGIMVQAVRAIVAYGFKTLPILRIFARPFGNNIASQRVLEKAGFILEARFEKTLFKDGNLLDELVYAVRR